MVMSLCKKSELAMPVAETPVSAQVVLIPTDRAATALTFRNAFAVWSAEDTSSAKTDEMESAVIPVKTAARQVGFVIVELS